ncbi:MAG: hypothetical protein WAM78_01915 [Candidatus Sulfotelmatobacter sp.]
MNAMPALGTTATNTENPHVLEVIRSAEDELTRLLQQRAEITRRMATLKQMLFGLAELFGDGILKREFQATTDRGMVTREKGLTQACRSILMESRTPLCVRQACEELQRGFPELAQRHKDLRASVTTIFHRLTSYAQARCSLDHEGHRVWVWATGQTMNTQQNQFADTRSLPQAELRVDD